MRLFLLMFGLSGIIPFYQVYAQEDNPFIRLYSERVNLVAAEIRQSEAELEFQVRRLDRYQRLVERNAISLEEFERAEADYKKSSAQIDVLAAKLAEEEAALEVVKYLAENGQPVPLCRQ